MPTLRDLIAGGDQRITGPMREAQFESGMLDRLTKRWQDHEERQAKDRADMEERYITLRKAGYSKEKAHEAATQKQSIKEIGQPQEDIYDIDYATKKAKLLKTQKETEQLGTAGYDSPEQVPKFQGDLELDSTTQDKKTGKWIGKYKSDKEKQLTAKQERDFANQKSKALAVLKRGFAYDDDGNRVEFSDRSQAEAYVIKNFKVNLNDADIRNQLDLYKRTEEKVKEPGLIAQIFKGQKYPRRKKYGYTYEKREDGKWHRLEE